MVKISLDDPIWTRLYGPYGVREASSMLKSLSEEWDDNLAKDLFWEELHHQDDLYPVTFAALPWLWDIAQQLTSKPREALFFFSHVLGCAVAPHGTGCDGEGSRGKYRGLALHTSDHAHSWIPSSSRLTEEDMNTLKRLEIWFDDNSVHIAETCLAAIGPEDIWAAAALAEGMIALKGGENVARAVTMWADGHPTREIIMETCLSPRDIRIAGAYSNQLKSQNPGLSDFLRLIADSKPATVLPL